MGTALARRMGFGMAGLELGLGLLRSGMGIRLGMGSRLVLLDSVLGMAALLVRSVAVHRSFGAYVLDPYPG